MQEVKKLSLSELKAKVANENIVANIEAINGGAEENCHNGKKSIGEMLQLLMSECHL
ncbi:hypothetical protein [Chitinophaga sp. Cy-1792]|uniref:hypothetical protein n=1 Tax=Chitinophaga sp. Cy-1792 TaxID=2608339 RepID=UPI0014243F2A|nr:hypothetical protein [Chitinophaga sp. Cy-1792]